MRVSRLEHRQGKKTDRNTQAKESPSETNQSVVTPYVHGLSEATTRAPTEDMVSGPDLAGGGLGPGAPRPPPKSGPAWYSYCYETIPVNT